LGHDPMSQPLVTELGRSTDLQFAFVALFGVLIAPATEEIVFRGVVFPSLRSAFERVRRARVDVSVPPPLPPSVASPARLRATPWDWTLWASAAITSAVFAAVHQSWTAALPLFALAMVLAWLYHRSGSLLGPILVHAANNALSLVPLWFLRE
jgi:membrane protease YdiL (CAAX protease family)